MYANPPPPYYANLENGQNACPPPPHHYNIPPYPTKYKRKSCGSGCCRCICCCCCFLFLLVVLMFVTLFTLFRLYDLRFPVYTVEDLQVKAFDIQPDFSLNTELELSVRAHNPSKRVGYIYGDNNWVDVTFKDISICSGKAHGFTQGHENMTVVKFDLKGKSRFDSGLQQAFNESLTKHWIPLLVKLRVPVNIMLGDTTLREIKAFVNCSLVLDNLAPNSTVGIISKDTRVHFEL
ncbi:hypothetical protein OROGR_012250 [Orobanche gracilis]